MACVTTIGLDDKSEELLRSLGLINVESVSHNYSKWMSFNFTLYIPKTLQFKSFSDVLEFVQKGAHEAGERVGAEKERERIFANFKTILIGK